MADGRQDHCPNCHQVVAPSDPERVENKHGVFHGNCWKKVRQIQEQIERTRYHDAGIWVQ